MQSLVRALVTVFIVILTVGIGEAAAERELSTEEAQHFGALAVLANLGTAASDDLYAFITDPTGTGHPERALRATYTLEALAIEIDFYEPPRSLVQAHEALETALDAYEEIVPACRAATANLKGSELEECKSGHSVAASELIEATEVLEEWQTGNEDSETERTGDSSPSSRAAVRTAGPTEEGTYVINGTFLLWGTEGDEFLIGPSGCHGTGGYSDIQPGAQITVRNENGTIIGTTELVPDFDAPDGDCAFIFSVEVPEAQFYTFTLGRRGDLSYSFEDLEDAGWTIHLSLG